MQKSMKVGMVLVGALALMVNTGCIQGTGNLGSMLGSLGKLGAGAGQIAGPKKTPFVRPNSGPTNTATGNQVVGTFVTPDADRQAADRQAQIARGAQDDYNEQMGWTPSSGTQNNDQLCDYTHVFSNCGN